MRKHIFSDPLMMPGTKESCEAVFERAVFLSGTPGKEYVERRGIPLDIAHSAGLKFCPSFAGRPAVLVRLFDDRGKITSVHGRYLSSGRGPLLSKTGEKMVKASG